MSKSATKSQRVSGGRIAVMIISVLLLSFIMAFGMLLGISSLKHNGPVNLGEDATTVRKKLPAEGANPMASSPLDNIGYMAYVMDNQPFYHAYAHNSTKSTGYEQITQTWKDYMTAEVSGEAFDVMVASDLSYSSLIKSSTQTCFIGDNEAHVRGGNKPGKNTQPNGIEWSKSAPSVYDKKGYKYSYGEFSTEISVYVINKDTLASADEVIDNGDGTYTQKYYLNENCGVWYQYKMKTNGGLKNFPEFKRVEIKFTFDSNYQIIESYCEERATISPRALGGMNMPSDSKTTTRYDYSEEGFDEQHFAYFANYFKEYVGTQPGDTPPVTTTVSPLDVLGSGFSKVVAPDGSGQQFKLAIKIGETDYDGRIYASLTDMSKIVETLDVRFELEKRGSGRQDLYAEFKNGKINVYYSSDFALTADLDGISASVGKITGWINKITKDDKKTATAFALSEEETQAGGGLSLDSLLEALSLEMTDTEATIKINSNDLLGLKEMLGIKVGVDLVMGFDRVIEEDGGNIFSVKSLNLNYINLNDKLVDISAKIVPDDGAKIVRKPAEAPADLAEYIDSVYSILDSKTIILNLGLEDKLIDGLTLDAAAYLVVGSNIAAKVEIDAEYKGITLKLDASYEIDTKSGDYGNVYLHISEINGTAVNARVYCNIKDTVKSVEDIIAIFTGKGEDDGNASDDIVASAKTELAEIINKVLNLNFEKIVGSVKGNSESISLEVDVDEILRGLDVSLGMEFGNLSLSVERVNPKIHGYISSLGLKLDVTGSKNALVLDKENFVDIKAYIDGVATLLNSTSYEVALKLQGTKINDSLNLEGLKIDGTAKIALKDGKINVALPVYIEYNEYAVNLTAYYTVSLSGGDFGDIYLNIEKMTVKTDEEVKEIELNAKIYCDINGAADTVNAIISRFTNSADGGNAVLSVAETDGDTSIIAKAVETLLKLNFNEVLNATNEKLTLNVNVDEILAGLGVSVGGISFGDLHLEYTTKTGTLSGTLEKLGLSVDILGTENEVTLTDGTDYVNLNTYLESVNTLLNRNSYAVKVLFDGKEIKDGAVVADLVDLKKLYIDATAKAAVVDGTLLVNLPAYISYDGYALTFGVFYTVDLATGDYGTVYLNVTEFETPEKVQELDAKVYCNIKNSVDAVNAIIGRFTQPASVTTYASMPAKGELLTNAISLLLSLDYKEIIHATNERLTVNLNVDEVLSGLGISLGDIAFGNLNLEFVTESGSLNGSLEKLGLSMSVEGSDEVLSQIDTAGYVDLGAYVTSVKELLNKNSYDVTVSFDGAKLPSDITSKLPEFVNVNALTLDLQAKLAFTGNFGGIDVAVSKLTISYENISLELAVRYSVNFNGEYGTVYLTVLSVDGTPVENANVTADIDGAVESVNRIIGLFKGNGEDNNGVSVYAATSSEDIISKVLDIVLKLDFNALINADADSTTVTVDLDSVLESFNLGVTLGTLTLEYAPETYTFTAADNDIGLSLVKVVGSDETISAVTGEYIDVNAYIDSVEALINSKTYEVGLHFTGKEITKKIDLTGLTLDAKAYVQATDTFSKFDVCVPLTVDYYGVSLSLVANYTIDVNADGLGVVYLEITKINGVNFAAKVYGDINEVIDAVEAVIGQFKTANGENGGSGEGDGENNTSGDGENNTSGDGENNTSGNIISKVIDLVLNLDYVNIITATQTELKVTLDVDDILGTFGFPVSGITFGELKLVYSTDGMLSGSLEKLGVNASVKGNDTYEMPVLDNGEYLNVAELLNVVNGMITEGKSIASAKDVAFTINANTTVDGKAVEAVGSGEVIWKDNNIKAAVSLDVTVEGEDSFALNFVFDKSAMDKNSEQPVAILSINGDAVKIFVKDTSDLVNSFKHLIEAFKKDNVTESDMQSPDNGSGYALTVGDYTVEELLKNDNVKKALGAILGFISDFTVTVADGDIDKIIVNYADDIIFTLCDGSYLSLKAEIKSFTLTASAEVGNSETYLDISADLAEAGKYTYYDLYDFIEIVYGNFFEFIDKELTFEKFIGDSAYSVELSLKGANSGITSLEGITVDATLYYDEGVDGTEYKTKLLHADLDLNISGTKVEATASFKGQTLYLQLTKIGSTNLSNVAFKTDVNNVYAAAEELVRLVTETDLVDTVNKFLGKGESIDTSDKENLSSYAMQRSEDGKPASNMLTKIIDAVLSLDLDKSFVFNKEEGTAKINIDSLSEAILGVKLGTLNVAANSEAKTLNASVSLDNSEAWITLNGAPCERNNEKIKPDDYMDIGFASTLASDLVKTLTDKNKHVYDLYTFSGSIKVPVNVSGIPVLNSINITLEFNNATITVGLDEKGDFYFTLAASMKKCTYAGFTITEGRDISITYSNGYVVLGRNIGATGSEIYKICTLNYLLDTLMDKDYSPVRWLLGTSGTVWGILVDKLSLDLSSGLTKPKTYTLYEQLQQNTSEGSFNLRKIISGLKVMADGEVLSDYGNGAELAVDKFGLTDNYYAFDINADNLTGGTLSKLCATVLRTTVNDPESETDGGITGIKLYGAIGDNDMVSFTVDLGNYPKLEGVKDVYGDKILVAQQTTVSSFEQLFDFREVSEGTVTADNVTYYYVFDEEQQKMVSATEYTDGVTYFESVNNTYYVKDGNNYVLATEYSNTETYYIFVDSGESAKLGTVAMRNYYTYACTVNKNHHFDPDRDFGGKANHIIKVFGCFNTEDGSYESSDVLETIYLDVYGLNGTLERTVEVLYGSTVNLISDFPEFADAAKTKKLIYKDKNNAPLDRSIYIEDGKVVFEEVDGKLRVSIYKSESSAYKVVFHFGNNVEGIETAEYAFVAGESLPEYPLKGLSFLGWYKEENLKTKVNVVVADDAVNNVIHVYGKYIVTLYQAENGVNYSFDTKLDGGRGGYYVSGVNDNITKYYNNPDEWLEIASKIDIYNVYYIGAEAFINSKKDVEHSLVNVLVPETVIAVYDKAFMDNKGLRQVVFFADNVFFGGRANSDGKTSAFYGCYTSVSGNVNTSFTVYYNGIRNNPFNHVSTTNGTVDPAWNRIYFNGNTNYTMLTKSSGWSYVEFETLVYGTDGELSSLPEDVDLSGIIHNGIYLTNYAEAGNLANAIAESIEIQLEKNIYSATASAALPTNGKRHFVTVTITEHEEVKEATSVRLIVSFNNSNLFDATKEVDIGVTLKDIYTSENSEITFNGKGNYSFIDWYTDADFKTLAPLTNNGRITELYAKIVPTTVTANNGVTYTFSQADENINEVHYKVTGFDTAKTEYTRSDNPELLVIANEWYGVKVAQIANNAFDAKGIKRVLVPSTVTYIGNAAFFDNKNMQEVIFLAEKVKFGGSVSGKDYPFYGCSLSNDDTQTKLKIYYNIANMPNEDWLHFKTDGTGDSAKILLIHAKGGEANKGGTWGYAEFTVTDGFELSGYGYNNGLIVSAINQDYFDSIVAKYVSKLNESTAESGVIYKYSVSVTEEPFDFNKDGIHHITITISNNSANQWNKINLDAESDIQIDFANSSVESVNGVFFAAENATVTIKPNAGNLGLIELTVKYDNATGANYYEHSVPKDDNGKAIVAASLSFEMPAQSVYVLATKGSLPISTVKFISVGTTVTVNNFEGLDATTVKVNDFEAVDGNYVSTIEKQDGSYFEGESLDAYTVSATGYTFIGWAYLSSGVLKFETDNAIHNPEYYAVWMYSRAEIDTQSLKLKEGVFNPQPNSALAKEIVGWYKYTTDDSNGNPTYTTEVSLNQLSVETTVINPRMKYRLTIIKTGNNVTLNDEDGKNVNGNKWITASGCDILDGYKVWLYAYAHNTDRLVLEIAVDTGTEVIAGCFYSKWETNLGIAKIPHYGTQIKDIKLTKGTDGTGETIFDVGTKNRNDNGMSDNIAPQKVFDANTALTKQHIVASNITLSFDMPKTNNT